MSQTPSVRQQDLELVIAYLDQELEPPEVKQVEQRLSTDAEFRQLLQQHERAWSLLDVLPKTEAGEKFVQSTVEMVAISAGDKIKGQGRFRRWGGYAWWGALALTAVAAVAIGFVTVRARLAASNRELARDLPVLENLDEYRHAESIEFLERLAAEGIFVEEAEHGL